MAKSIVIEVKESLETLQSNLRKAPIHQHPRLKMLLQIAKGVTSVATLCAKTGAHRDSITAWKKRYAAAGLEGLLSDHRGGDFRSGFSEEDKEKIEKKLSDPNEAFTTFGQAQDWINKELGTEKRYHAINKYLKRNLGVKLKVGRKSHVNKDKEAVAFFKKPVEKP